MGMSKLVVLVLIAIIVFFIFSKNKGRKSTIKFEGLNIKQILGIIIILCGIFLSTFFGIKYFEYNKDARRLIGTWKTGYSASIERRNLQLPFIILGGLIILVGGSVVIIGRNKSSVTNNNPKIKNLVKNNVDKNKYCSNCGMKINESSNFCPNCGHKI